MKLPAVIAIAAAFILSLSLIPFMSSCGEIESTVEREREIPLIDAERPAVTETATFALG